MPKSRKNISGARQNKKNLRKGTVPRYSVRSEMSDRQNFQNYQGFNPLKKSKFSVRASIKSLGKRTFAIPGNTNRLNKEKAFSKGLHNQSIGNINDPSIQSSGFGQAFPFVKSRENTHPQHGFRPYNNPSFPMPNYNSKALGQENLPTGVVTVNNNSRDTSYNNYSGFDDKNGSSTPFWYLGLHYVTSGYQSYNDFRDNSSTPMDRPCLYGGFDGSGDYHCYHRLATHVTPVPHTNTSTTRVSDFHATLCEVMPEIYCNPHCDCSLKECGPDNCGGYCGTCEQGYCRHEASNTGMMLDKKICATTDYQQSYDGECLCLTSDTSVLLEYNITDYSSLSTNGFYNSGKCYDIAGEQIGTSGQLIERELYHPKFGFDTKKNACGMMYGTYWVYHPTGGGGCFVEGTLIDTPNGDIPIENIKLGDEIYSFNDYDDEKIISIVENLVSHEPDETTGKIVKIKTNLNEVVTTLNHPFITIDVEGVHRWEQVSDLKVGDTVIGENGEELIIEEIDILKMNAETYNLTIKDTHHYIANGFRVHNAYGRNQQSNIGNSRRVENQLLDNVTAEPKPHPGLPLE